MAVVKASASVLLPMKCRTPEARNVLLGYFSKQVNEALIDWARHQQYGPTVNGAPGKLIVYWEVRHRGRLVMVEVAADPSGGAFELGLWVNGKESKPERMSADLHRAFHPEEDDDYE